MTGKIPALHPGKILKEEFMIPFELTGSRLAKDLGVPASRINSLVHGRRRINADIALRLGAYFGLPPQFWMTLQADYDLRLAAAGVDLKKIKPKAKPKPPKTQLKPAAAMSTSISDGVRWPRLAASGSVSLSSPEADPD